MMWVVRVVKVREMVRDDVTVVHLDDGARLRLLAHASRRTEACRLLELCNLMSSCIQIHPDADTA